MAFPENDTEYHELQVQRVETVNDDGWTIETEHGCLFVPKGPVKPREGMTARFYSKGALSRVRGLFLDGQEVWYRTAEDDKRDFADQLYGKDAADLLSRWDNGDTVWTLSMGGLGPGYEQAIQIMMFEMLRALLNLEPDEDQFTPEKWPALRDRIEGAIAETIEKIGPSGAQFGAALNLATGLYHRGPQAIRSEVSSDRHIQVSRAFPSAA